jgi:hypothetical protein
VGKKWQLGGESDQSTLYACMEMSKWSSFAQLIYANVCV